MKRTHYTKMASPVGKLFLVETGGALTRIVFDGARSRAEPEAGWAEDAEPFREVIRQLGEYFVGERRAFRLDLQPCGTGFQRSVWEALRDIPYGATVSYGEIARRIGRPSASRAVGAANGRNPLPIVIPCHRVVGTSGDLIGYGGGLERKRTLLALEGAWTERHP